MNESTPHSRRRNIRKIAAELCELYQQQIDTLQHGTLAGLPKGKLEQYSKRQKRIGNCGQSKNQHVASLRKRRLGKRA